jgi:PAS domain S-box-containing protein
LFQQPNIADAMIRLFKNPNFDHPETNSKARLLYKMIWAVLIIITSTFIVAISIQPQFIERYLFIILSLWLLSTGIVILLHKGYVKQSSILYITILFLLIIGMSFTGGGIRGHGIRLLPVLVLFSGLAIGTKQVWLVGAITIITTLLMVVLELNNLIPVVTPLGNHPILYWFYTTQIILLLCFMEYLSVQRFNEAINQVKNETSLRIQQEEKYKKIVESFQDIFYRVDTNNNIIMITPSVKERLGYEVEEVIGRQVTDFYGNPELRENLLLQLKMHGEVKDYEVDLINKKGQIRNMVVSCRILHDDKNSYMGIEGILHDITLRKANELKLKEQNQRLKEIANLQSHMVRRPVANVLGLISILDHQNMGNPENAEVLKRLGDSSNELDNVIKQIVAKTKDRSDDDLVEQKTIKP